MNIVYLVFGDNLDHYQQVYFSIYTAAAYKNTNDRIIVVAENPALFSALQDQIEIIPINRDVIKEWEGKHQFFWRVKIKALELIAQKYPQDSILYLDGDTFFYKNLDTLREGLKNGQNYMHVKEGKLHELPSKTEKLMWRQMKGKTYHDVKIDENSEMWNAGLIGISHHHFDCIGVTLGINDEMCADHVTRRLIEQFAFSLGLNEFSRLQRADHIVGHYWGNKKQWNHIIDRFLKECFMKNYSFDQMTAVVKDMDLTQNPIRVRESNTQKRLKRFIDQFFKDDKAEFVSS